MEDKYISGIIAKYLANEANAEEQHLLLEWIAEDPLHQQVFLEYCNVWQEVNYPAPVLMIQLLSKSLNISFIKRKAIINTGR